MDESVRRILGVFFVLALIVLIAFARGEAQRGVPTPPSETAAAAVASRDG